MNKELALRTLAYLKGQYKANGEIIINKEEIKAIDFILDDNKQLIDLINEYENKGYDIGQERADFLLEIQDLQQQLDKYKNVIDKIKKEIEMLNSCDYNTVNFIICITKINELLEEVE